jgi:hypothetical protein
MKCTQKMKLILFNILILISTGLTAQTDLGIGLVSINYDDQTILQLYNDTTDTKAAKTIEFFNDPNIGIWNIKNIESNREWLKPEVLELEFSVFTFRCLNKSADWLEIIANNKSGKTYWIKNNNLTGFKTWENFLKGMVSIAQLPKDVQKISVLPSYDSETIEYRGEEESFQVKSMKEEWIEIYTEYIPEHFDEYLESGWIRWREGNRLLIQYYITY